MNKESGESTLILAVDDQLENLQLLGHLLRKNNYKVAVANNGAEALHFVDKVIPDLILLDIMMPQTDGLEVCKILKSNPRFADIPIIFLTAKNSTDDIVQGFKNGGVDYITKPFNPEELLIRVKTHIDLKHSKTIIQKQNEKLKLLNQEKNEFFSIAVHDLKNPLNVVMGFTKLMIDEMESMPKASLVEALTDVYGASAGMYDIVADLIDVNKLEQNNMIFRKVSTDLHTVVKENVNSMSDALVRKFIELQVLPFAGHTISVTDDEKVSGVVKSWLNHALLFSPPNGKIIIKLTNDNSGKQNYVVLSISDEGPVIEKDEAKGIFNKFFKLKNRIPQEGLHSGLMFAKSRMIIEALDGSVGCTSGPKGITLFFKLPI